MEKAPDAFRTISEVAEDLELPQHVLRFWETRFAQIKPLKRGGGRRYYRPDDVDLLKGIRHLLYGEGYTIRGVQRLIKDHGVKSIIDLGRGTGSLLAEKPNGPDVVNPEPAPQRPAARRHVPEQAGLELGEPAPPPPAEPGEDNDAGTVQKLRAGLRGLAPAFRTVEPEQRPAPPEPNAPAPHSWPETPPPNHAASGLPYAAPASPHGVAAHVAHLLAPGYGEAAVPEPVMQYPRRIHNTPKAPAAPAPLAAYPVRIDNEHAPNGHAPNRHAPLEQTAPAGPSFPVHAKPHYGEAMSHGERLHAAPQPDNRPAPIIATPPPAAQTMPSLSADAVNRLQAAMLDLMECRKLLDDAIKR